MWYKAQSVGAMPLIVDDRLSSVYVYIRKDIVHTLNDDGIDVWDYYEQKMLKEDWQTYGQIISRNETVVDNTEAILELSEIIGG